MTKLTIVAINGGGKSWEIVGKTVKRGGRRLKLQKIWV